MKKSADEVIAFLSNKRERKILRRKRRNAPSRRSYEDSKRPRYNSEPLRLLREYGKAKIKIQRKNPEYEIHMPGNFSIIDNPKEALELYIKFSTLSGHHLLKKVDLNYRSVKSVDLAAESIFDCLANELQKEYRHGRSPKGANSRFSYKGTYPTDPLLQRFLKAVGIIKNLAIEHEYLPKTQEDPLEIFKLVNNRTAVKGDVVKGFVDHINRCLGLHQKKLTNLARAKLSQYLGEILDNVEQHSGLKEWNISGYLDIETQGHICEISIFNFGKTFSQSFLDLDRSSYAFKEIEPFILEHKKKTLFGQDWREEDLITLVALQGHISSKNTSADSTRGQGTVDLISFFQRIYQECSESSGSCGSARMALLSGSTHILFDGRYAMADDGTGRKVIAFNDSNDLSIKPNPKYVSRFEGLSFPGTVISIRFPLQESQVESIQDGQ